MQQPKQISPLTAFIFLLGYFFCLLALQRFGFLWLIHNNLSEEPLSQVSKALDIGLRFDGRIATLMTMPLGILLGIPPLRRFLGKHKAWLMGMAILPVFGLWLVFATDAAFFFNR